MKQLLFLFISLFLFSCSKSPVSKPDNFLDEEVMIDIVFDISVLQAANGTMPYKLKDSNIEMDQYIFKKYKIDSLTYSQNQRYYASNPRKYKNIYKKVVERLEQENVKLKEAEEKLNTSNGTEKEKVSVD